MIVVQLAPYLRVPVAAVLSALTSHRITSLRRQPHSALAPSAHTVAIAVAVVVVMNVAMALLALLCEIVE